MRGSGRAGRELLDGGLDSDIRDAMFSLIAALFLSTPVAQATLSSVEELRIIQAAAHDAFLLDLCGGRFEIEIPTVLSRLHPWVSEESSQSIGPNTAIPRNRRIVRDGTQDVLPLSSELIQSALARNQERISVRGVRPPAANTWQGTRNPRASYWLRVAFSRPGISEDGMKAIVAVEERTGVGPAGYTVYLEKRGDVWTVVGHGGNWIV